jgi:ABC-2 type transport system permease protein
MDWGQLRTIGWLRVRLIRNQWARGGKLNAALSMLAVIAGTAIGVAGGIGGVAAGAFVLAKASPAVMLIVWDLIVGAFLFFWMIGVVTELQRSETIDIGRLLHLPVSLKDIFIVNYVASHLTLSLIVFGPVMLGLCLGLVLGGRWSMVWMFPLVLGLIFMVTAWTYCLRGWLAALMVNKRRRRAIIAGITFAFVLLSQLPNLLGNVLSRPERHRLGVVKPTVPERQPTIHPGGLEPVHVSAVVLAVHKYVPVLWVANGAMSLARGSAWPAILGAAGAIGIGGLGLRRAYRSTLHFYSGSGGRAARTKSARKPKAAKPAAVRPGLFDRRIPGVPDEAAAAALAFFHSLMRAPEVKMALAANFLMLLIFGAMILVRRSSGITEPFKPFVTPGAIVFVFLGASQLMFNQFGFDRAGFRQLVLLPAPRKWILLGKNLAFAPIALTTGLVILVLAVPTLHISLTVFLAGLLQLVTALLIISVLGNFLSVLIPYRITAGSLRRTKTSATTTLLIFLSRLLFPTAMIPLFIPPAMGLLFSQLGWLPADVANLLLSVAIAGLLAFLYKLSLTPLGELLQQREKKILQVVTEEVE